MIRAAADRLVLVPMKDPAQAKTRLGARYDARQRAAIAWRLFRRTLSALRRTQASVPFDLAVVSTSPAIEVTARAAGALFLPQAPGCETLSQVIQTAAAWADGRGHRSLCVLPADLAAPDPADLATLLALPLEDHRAVLTPSTDMGTNALLLTPPAALPFAYGPRSFLRHWQAAETAGLNPKMLPLPSLRWDVDTTDDMARLLAHEPGFAQTLRDT
ncbi:MAG: 2-phospho-L-lactate guanylyltransferase [Pseudomonadota bacterium]